MMVIKGWIIGVIEVRRCWSKSCWVRKGDVGAIGRVVGLARDLLA